MRKNTTISFQDVEDTACYPNKKVCCVKHKGIIAEKTLIVTANINE